jgi:hypothetical protein
MRKYLFYQKKKKKKWVTGLGWPGNNKPTTRAHIFGKTHGCDFFYFLCFTFFISFTSNIIKGHFTYLPADLINHRCDIAKFLN